MVGITKVYLLRKWLQKQFIPSIPPAQPMIILQDGHSSYYDPEAITEGKIFCLPSYTFHVAQPLNVRPT